MGLERWAAGEFASARLGNELRTKRAVSMAASCALRLGGRVTEVFEHSADREGAFRFLENEAVDEDALMAAAHQACVRRCSHAEFSYVPVDKSSLSLPGTIGGSDFGMVGNARAKAHGVQVMSAVAVTPDGTPQGLVAQQYWTRGHKRKIRKKQKSMIPLVDKETQRWLDVLERAATNFSMHSPSTKPWFQIDREGDASPILEWAVAGGHWLTVRASWDRRVGALEPASYLWSTMERLRPMGRYAVTVPGTPNRVARRATMEVRASRVTLQLPRPKSNNPDLRTPLDLHVVLASEVDTAPPGEKPLEWMLLTTRSVSTFDDACDVLFGYTQRWRIEEFHKMWKSGACRVEDSQLRRRDHLVRWAILLASVAVRLLRMSYLARERADDPASVEFSAIEIRAIILRAKPKRAPAAPTIGQAVMWIAQLGGYTSAASSGGPPGPLVLARGLELIQIVAETLAAVEET
jgi:hypothetical protein